MDTDLKCASYLIKFCQDRLDVNGACAQIVVNEMKLGYHIFNPLNATGQVVRRTMISRKMSCTSQSMLFIFQVVKLPLYRAAVNTHKY